jgi:hypothetical protein
VHEAPTSDAVNERCEELAVRLAFTARATSADELVLAVDPLLQTAADRVSIVVCWVRHPQSKTPADTRITMFLMVVDPPNPSRHYKVEQMSQVRVLFDPDRATPVVVWLSPNLFQVIEIY